MKIYVCGPTVYSEVHIGNMRPILIFDTVANAYKYIGEEVQFIHNITDIDDKIIKVAKDNNISEQEVSNKYFDHYKFLLEKFNINTITHMPTVIENMDNIISFIEKLIENGNAYVMDGNVWFDISSDNKYGSISNNDPEKVIHQEESNKRNQGDFALWKNTDDGIKFDSPWGKGRPGWHTECAVFVDTLSSTPLDIHGGGIDLIFPHHENEASQYRVLNNKEITNAWRHVGHLSVDDLKMSKSLGNIIKASDFIKDYDPDVLRLIYLTTNYSSPLNINEELLESNVKKFLNIKKLYMRYLLEEVPKVNSEKSRNFAMLITSFNFSDLSYELNQLIKSLNKSWNKEETQLLAQLVEIMNFDLSRSKIDLEDLNSYKKYLKAKEEKDFDLSDNLRGQLTKKGLL